MPGKHRTPSTIRPGGTAELWPVPAPAERAQQVRRDGAPARSGRQDSMGTAYGSRNRRRCNRRRTSWRTPAVHAPKGRTNLAQAFMPGKHRTPSTIRPVGTADAFPWNYPRSPSRVSAMIGGRPPWPPRGDLSYRELASVPLYVRNAVLPSSFAVSCCSSSVAVIHIHQCPSSVALRAMEGWRACRSM